MQVLTYRFKDQESRRICVLKSLFENLFTKFPIRYDFGCFFSRYDLRTVTVILWKSGKPVSIEHEFWKLQTEFVNIKSIVWGLSRFLKYFGNLIKFFSLNKLQKSLIWMFCFFYFKGPHKGHFVIICY